jgi:hypothetical protein
MVVAQLKFRRHDENLQKVKTSNVDLRPDVDLLKEFEIVQKAACIEFSNWFKIMDFMVVLRKCIEIP